MNTLCTLTASPHGYGVDPGMCGIDLFPREQGYLTLQVEATETRRLLARTSCNLVHLRAGEEECLATVSGWPHPWNAGRLTLDEVAPEEIVRLHARVSLACVPECIVSGACTLEKSAPWIEVQGPALRAAAPLLARFANPQATEFHAGELDLPPGVRLVTPPGQVLYRLTASPAPATEVLHA